MDKNYLLAFSVCDGVGPKRLQTLLAYFGSAKNAWEAPFSEIEISGIGRKLATHIVSFRKTFQIDHYLQQLHEKDIWFVTLMDDTYPSLLKRIHRPPIILYGKGDSTCLSEDKTKLAVVGTRKITDYGRQVTALFVQELVNAGCVIVSGLAMGVDAVAHQATLDAGGKTIAVLGSGVDLCTPQENSILYQRILANGGLIISETPMGVMPNKGSFPARNRIIAGISEGVLVTEGAEDSGSLITAHDAIDEGRKVFAVPGPITSSVSKGPISLIGKGAKMATTGRDILDGLGMKNSGLQIKKVTIVGDTPDEQKIIAVLQNESLSFDEIVRRTGFATPLVGTTLSLMELKSLIKKLNDGRFGLF